MKNSLKTAVTLVALFSTLPISTPAMAEGQASANIGILSSYISRGIPLSNDKLSLSPGLHYQTDNGFFTGFRGYTTGGAEPFFEIDSYVGKGGRLSDNIGYEATLLSYRFPDQENFGTNHFEEVALKGTYDIFEIYYSRFLNSLVKGDQYYSISVNKPLENEITLGALAGYNNYSSRNDPDGIYDYNHYQVSAVWKDFTLAVDYNDNKLIVDETKVSLGWRKYFNF